MKKNNEEYQDLVSQLIPYANDELANFNLHLTPGTYTAADLHKMLESIDKHYWAQNRDNYKATSMESTKRPRRTISNALGNFEVPYGNALYLLNSYEKLAGLTGYKANKWIIDDPRNIVASATVTFPDKKSMMKLIKIEKEDLNNGDKTLIFSIVDGYLRSIVTTNDCDYNTNIFYRIGGKGYSPIEGYEDIIFKIGIDQIKHLYGNCKIELYKDDTADINSYRDPYHIRLVIKNSDGWSFSLNDLVPVSQSYIKIYDALISESEENIIDELETETNTKKSNISNVAIPDIHQKTLVEEYPLEYETANLTGYDQEDSTRLDKLIKPCETAYSKCTNIEREVDLQPGKSIVSSSVKELSDTTWSYPRANSPLEIYPLLQNEVIWEYYSNWVYPCTAERQKIIHSYGFPSFPAMEIAHNQTSTEKPTAIGIIEKYRFLKEYLEIPLMYRQIPFNSKMPLNKQASSDGWTAGPEETTVTTN